MNESPSPATVTLRPATPLDFAFCTRLYVEEAKRTNPEFARDLEAVIKSLTDRWDPNETRIIEFGGADVGWIQAHLRDGALFLRQFIVESSLQRQGIGAAVLHLLIAGTSSAGRALTLGVYKNNPAKRLYEKFGFQVTHEDDKKFYMRREAAGKEAP